MPNDFSDPIKEQPKRKRAQGRPKHSATPELRAQARGLAAVGTPHPDIAFDMGISEDTLYRYYRNDLRQGAIRAIATVARTIYQQAVGDNDHEPNMTAAIFFMKCRAGWKETSVLEHVRDELGQLSDEEIERRIEAIEDKRHRVRTARTALHERVQERPADILH